MRRPAIARGRRSLLVLLVVVVWWSGGATPVAAAPARPEEGEIERLYRAALGRQAEIGGFHYWVKRRQTDLTLEAIASFFLVSAEFDRRFGAPDDLSFVTLVYAQVLERVPDEGGRQYWLDRLAGGLSRQRLVLLFSESPEFMDRTGTRPPVLPSFEATVRGVSTDDLGASWRSGCPVGPSRLRLVEVSHVTATGGSATGRIVVHESVAGAVVGVFERLYVARFPIERMQTIGAFGGDDNASMDANNTSGFNCRLAVGSTWSRHAYGTAIDLNPRQNPYVRGATILPPAGATFSDRGIYDPLMIREGDAVVQAFDRAGWRWGGRWSSPIDYQHFER